MELYVPFITLKSPLATAHETALIYMSLTLAYFRSWFSLISHQPLQVGEVGAAEMQGLQSI